MPSLSDIADLALTTRPGRIATGALTAATLYVGARIINGATAPDFTTLNIPAVTQKPEQPAQREMSVNARYENAAIWPSGEWLPNLPKDVLTIEPEYDSCAEFEQLRLVDGDRDGTPANSWRGRVEIETDNGTTVYTEDALEPAQGPKARFDSFWFGADTPYDNALERKHNVVLPRMRAVYNKAVRTIAQQVVNGTESRADNASACSAPTHTK